MQLLKKKNRETLPNEHSDLSNTIFLCILIFSVLGLVLSFILFRKSTEKVHTAYFKNTLEKSTKHELIDIKIRMNEIVNQLQTTASAINRYDDLSHPDIKKILEFSNEMNWFHYTAVADMNGNGFDNANNSFNVADRKYFQTAMNGQIAFSEVLKSKILKDKYIQVIAYPLKKRENKVQGVVIGIFYIQDFNHNALHKSIDSSNNLYVVDSNGNYIAKFQKNSSIITDQNFWSDLEHYSYDAQKINQLKSDFQTKKDGTFSYKIHDETRHACYMPLGPNNWKLIYSVSANSLNKLLDSVYKIDTYNMILATVCYILLLGCVIWYFKQSNNKIRNAHQTAKRNMELMRISMDHSKHIIFEYNQSLRQINLKTNHRNLLFNDTTICSVPVCFISRNLIAPESIPVLTQLFKRIQTEKHCEEDIHLHNELEEIWYRVSMTNLYDERNELIDTVGVVEDISEQKRQEVEVRQKLQLQDTLISNALLYAKIDLENGSLLELNGEKSALFFHDFLHDHILTHVGDIHISYVTRELSLDSLRRVYEEYKQSFELQFLWNTDHESKWVSCVIYRVQMDATSKVILVITDIDHQKRKELVLKEQAQRDGLTGLYNAATARLKINKLLSFDQNEPLNHLFVLIDLDNFKLINDTFGHSYGDYVLTDVASILTRKFRSSDIVCRLGGDEFIVFLHTIKSYEHVEGLIKELCDSLHKTYGDEHTKVTISASIGMAIAPYDGTTFQELYKKSDIAQYQVKKNKKNGYMLYQNKDN